MRESAVTSEPSVDGVKRTTLNGVVFAVDDTFELTKSIGHGAYGVVV